jgi:hypothetical protein
MSAYIDYCIAQLEADLEPSDFDTWWEHEKELINESDSQ